MDLKDNAIIVTGGASGIGRAAALALSTKGARVIVADYNETGAQSVADEVKAAGGEAHAFKVDVSKAEQVEAMVEFAVVKFGTLTGIFNNAGISGTKPFLDMAPEAYHRVIDVDQHGVYHGMYYAARKMVALGAKGTIVNTASIYGTLAAPHNFNYNVAKAAVVMMSKAGALELAPQGIRVVGVAPGFIDTPMFGDNEALKAEVARQHVHDALIQPEKVASVVAFLFTDAASAINGTTVAVDDGFLAFKAR